ncbi:MAG: SDR family oxidoreductase [Terriglobia bacterium]
MNPRNANPGQQTSHPAPSTSGTFWRVEGSLLNLSAVRPVAFFASNAQSFSERWIRRGGLGLLALVRPLLYATHRVFATRVLHTVLRRVSRDRLDLLGEEYFHYVLKPRLKRRGIEKLKEYLATDGTVILVSQGLDHVMRPLAEFLGVERLVANRLEFRHGFATGRLLEPVIRPRGGLARFASHSPDGRISSDQLCRDLGFPHRPDILTAAIIPAKRQQPKKFRPIVLFKPSQKLNRLSVRESLAGKQVLLIGVTGFIGKIWLGKLLSDLPEIGRFYLLIRRQGANTAQRRFQKIVEESPVFDGFRERYGNDLAGFLHERAEVVEGDVTQPGLGIEPATRARLARTLALIVNSSGLTDFNPDLRQALATNIDATLHVLDFLRQCDHAGLLHLSTCYVVGARDGRVSEEFLANYTPAHRAGFDAERERQALHALVKDAVARSESSELTAELRREALKRIPSDKGLSDSELETHIRRYRSRWLRNHLTEAATRRAKELGWPNTYTFTKSLAESLIEKYGADLPVALVRPSIVETSLQEPFRGWTEGINTSAPLSYLLGTYFRQLPSNERKCLDLIPVDLVCRGLTLVAAALVQRCHERVYQLATSATNPCDMRRSIELTSLAHRKHYRAQEGLEHWLRYRFDSIPVSKTRYQKFSAPGQKAIVRLLKHIISPLPVVRSRLERRERKLERMEKLIELYEPFILHNEHVFEAENIEWLSQALPSEETDAFGYDARSFDWWDYWINIHVPALRKWVYPLIEGRPLEYRPRHSVPLAVPSPTSPAQRNAAAPATRP